MTIQPLQRLRRFVGCLAMSASFLCGTAGAADIVTRYGYDDAGQMTFQAVETDGRRLSEKWIQYDSLGRAWRTRELAAPGTPGPLDQDPVLGAASEAEDRVSETFWDADGQVVLERRRYGTGWAATTFEYDTLKRSVATVDAEGGRTGYVPDGRGSPVEVVDPAGNRIVLAYDAAGNAVLEQRYETREGVEALALQINRRFDSRGNKIVEIQGDGLAGTAFDQALPAALTQQRWAYDACGRPSREVQMAAPASVPPSPLPTGLAASTAVDRVTDYAYVFDTKKPLAVRTYGGDVGQERATHFTYDDMGRPTQITDVGGNTRTYAYVPVTDPPEPGEGQAASKTLASAGLPDQVFTYEYDGFDRRKTETDADQVTRYAYDGLGRRTQMANPNGIVTQYELNAFGDQKKVVEDLGGLARTTQMHYDQLGRLDWQEADDSDGHVERTTYAYDLMDRRTGIVFPDGGCYTYVYDDAGRMTSRTDPRGQVTTYTHNWRGQVWTKTVDGVLKESFSYYPTGWMKAAWIDAATEATATTKSVFTCDAFGQARTVTQTVDGVARTIASDFYPSGDRKQLTYPADVGVALAYTYDDLGQATQITRQIGTGSAVPLASYTYAGQQLLSRDITTVSPTETHIRYEVGLDAHRRPVRLTNKTIVGSTTTVLDQTDYTFDPNGNRKSARVTAGDQRLTQTAGTAEGQGYGYDPLDRLTAAVYPTGAGSESFCYDLLGNRVATGPQGEPGYVDRAGRISSYSHNEVNEYTSITVASQAHSPVHDDAGNLTSTESGYGLAYDYENRLVKVYEDANRNGTCDAGETVLADYTYDALGHRVKQVKDSQTTRYYYDNETVLAEYDSQGNLLRYHVHGPTYVDEHVLLHEAGQGGEPGQGGSQPQEYYYLLTHLYSVSGLANASGAAVERYRYDAYGAPTRLAFGNFNGDDKVDLRDFLVFQQAYSGETPCTDAARICDYNGDGKVNLADYRGFDVARRGAAGAGAGAGGGGSVGDAGGISPFRFTGQPLDFHLTDNTTGRPTLVLYHYRARAYDAYHGRFCQRDPAEYEDGMNLYEYVRSQPSILRDPTGRSAYLDLLSGSLNYGMRAYNAYETGSSVRGYVEAIVAGADLRSVVLSAAVEAAASYGGGKAFDKLLGTLGSLTAKYAKEGVDNAVRSIARKAGEHLHHLLPKFLDGDTKGLLGILPKDLHQKFHGGLLKLLAENNIKLTGQKGYTWEKLFREHPEYKMQAWDLLLQYTESFDAANGTYLLRGLMDQITKQLKDMFGDLVM